MAATSSLYAGNIETVSHPKYWTMAGVTDTNAGFYAATTFTDMTNNSAWVTNLDTAFGATQQTASKTADTYYTYCDISGSHGAMGTIILPQVNVNSTAGFYTIKLTTDGVEEEFKTKPTTGTGLHADHRYFYGPYGDIPNDTTAATRIDAVATRGGRYMSNFGYLDSTPNGIYQGLIIPVQTCIIQGIPVHPYTTSLKVEVKCSHVGAPWSGRYYESYGGVLYTATPNI
tara:strand:+ start:277 stop:963 length:687 start_codon:yes stop_codon:yes gene_type:complete